MTSSSLYGEAGTITRGESTGKQMNHELRQTAIACLHIAGEQRLCREPDVTVRLSGQYEVDPDRAAQMLSRSKSVQPMDLVYSGATYAPVHVKVQRRHDDPPEGFWYLIQVEYLLKELDAPAPNHDPNTPPPSHYSALFEHRYMRGRPIFTYSGPAKERVLIDTLAHHLGQITIEDLTIVQAAVREFKQLRAERRRQELKIAAVRRRDEAKLREMDGEAA